MTTAWVISGRSPSSERLATPLLPLWIARPLARSEKSLEQEQNLGSRWELWANFLVFGWQVIWWWGDGFGSSVTLVHWPQPIHPITLLVVASPLSMAGAVLELARQQPVLPTLCRRPLHASSERSQWICHLQIVAMLDQRVHKRVLEGQGSAPGKTWSQLQHIAPWHNPRFPSKLPIQLPTVLPVGKILFAKSCQLAEQF